MHQDRYVDSCLWISHVFGRVREFENVGGVSDGAPHGLELRSPSETSPTAGLAPNEFPDDLIYLTALSNIVEPFVPCVSWRVGYVETGAGGAPFGSSSTPRNPN